MDTRELLSARKKLENDLQNIIQARLEKFKEESGLEVDDISVGMAEITQIGSVGRKYYISNVSIHLSF